jgi:hypothetical protein
MAADPARPVYRVPRIPLSAPVVLPASDILYCAVSTITLETELPPTRDRAGKLVGYQGTSGSLLRP